jgi:hypothetical protein
MIPRDAFDFVDAGNISLTGSVNAPSQDEFVSLTE